MLALFPDAAFAALLYKFALINYFVIFLNLIPLLELDGYWILTDLIQVPNLRPRSLEFFQHDLWHKLRTRTRLTQARDRPRPLRRARDPFTIFSFYSAYFFWKRIFGGLVSSLWNGGFGSRILLVLLVTFLAGPAIRGVIQLVRALFRRVRAIVRGLVFRAETKWRVEAAELVDELPAFDDLPVETLNDLAGRVTLRRVRAGQPVFRQGDRPTAFYVVRHGQFAVEEEHPDTGDVQVLRLMERGESFGEMGLLTAGRRAATVRAVEDGEVFELSKATFDRLLADSIHAPRVRTHDAGIRRTQGTSPVRRPGDHEPGRVARARAVGVAASRDTAGDTGRCVDHFYVIHSGQATVSVSGTDVRILGPGSHFGEIGLLSSSPRSATVTTLTSMRAFVLDREGFDRVIAEAFTRGNLKLATGRTWHH